MKDCLKILILGDSHSSNYGVLSYHNYFPKEWSVDIYTISGLPISKAERAINFYCDNYDLLIIQLGNPDCHPRIKKNHINFFKEKVGIKLSQSWFFLPANLSFKFFLKIPFFLIKRFYTLFYLESFTTPKNVVKVMEEIFYGIGAKQKIIIPPFEVDERYYGKFHNENVRDIKERLMSKFGSNVLNVDFSKIIMGADGFHFKKITHAYLAETIVCKYNELSGK